MAKRYTVRYELDEDGVWVATIPKLSGCVTQGRSIAQARALGAQSAELVGRINRERTELETRKRAVARSTAQAARKLAKAGLSVRDVGELLGLSHQRVQQLLEHPHAA